MITGRFHIIIDLEKLEPDILNDEEGLKGFLVTLTKQIDMHVLLGPYVTNGIPANPGLSGFVIIDYSHISIHTFTQNNEAQVDIFSCKSFDKDKAMDAVLTYFKAKKSSTRYKEVFWG